MQHERGRDTSRLRAPARRDGHPMASYRGTAAPYSVPVGLAFFKLPAGALTAIAGLVLIKGDFVPGFSQLDSQGQILAYAGLLNPAPRSRP